MCVVRTAAGVDSAARGPPRHSSTSHFLSEVMRTIFSRPRGTLGSKNAPFAVQTVSRTVPSAFSLVGGDFTYMLTPNEPGKVNNSRDAFRP